MPVAFRPAEILRRLEEFEIDYIVVGGVAGTLVGSPITTQDLDLVYDVSKENLAKLTRFLGSVNARYRDPAGRTISPDEERLATIKVNLLTTDLGDLDLLREIGSGLNYRKLQDRTITSRLNNSDIPVIDLETQIEAKTVAGRPKDLLALPFLRRLLAMRRETLGGEQEGEPLGE